MHERCERIVAGQSVPWTQSILGLMNFIGNLCQKNVEHYYIKEDFKFELFKFHPIFHPIFLSTVFQDLCCSFYCVGDMKELKGNTIHFLKSNFNELKFSIEPYMKTNNVLFLAKSRLQ